MKRVEGRNREKSQQPGGGGDLFAYNQETGEREERVKRSNSRGRGGDFSANAKKISSSKLTKIK